MVMKPTTQAGERLLRRTEAWDLGERPDHQDELLRDVLAIEAEARIGEGADLREDVLRIPTFGAKAAVELRRRVLDLLPERDE